MKLLRQRLVNFIGIEQGIGVYDFEIDYSTCPYRKIIFLGKNGAGKSVIQSTATPFRETFDNRSERELIIQGRVGIKEVDYLHNDFIYKIVHVYGGETKANKSFITKHHSSDPDSEGENLNKSGIQKGFLEACRNELGVTPDFIKLVKLGSRTASIIDFNSTDRKKFIGNFVPNVSEYLTAYKNATKHYNNLNRDVKVITRELDMLGNEEDLLNEAQTVKAQIKGINSSLSKLRVTLEKFTEKLASVPENRQKLLELQEEINVLQPQFDMYERKRDQIDDEMANGFSKRGFDFDKISDLLDTINTNLQGYSENISKLETEIAVHEASLLSVKSDIQNNETTISKIRSNIKGFESEEVSELVSRLEDLEKNIKTLESLVEENSNYSSVLKEDETPSDVVIHLNDVKKEISAFASLRNDFSINALELIENRIDLSNLETKINQKISVKKDKMKIHQEEIDKLSEKFKSIQSTYVEYKEVTKHLDECTCGDECGLVDHIKANANLTARKEKLDGIQSEINALEKLIEILRKEVDGSDSDFLEEVTELILLDTDSERIRFLKEVRSMFVGFIPELKDLTKPTQLLFWLNTTNQRKVLDLIKDIQSHQKNIMTLELNQNKVIRYKDQLRALEATNEEIGFYEKQITNLQKKYSELKSSEEYINNLDELSSLKKRVSKVKRSKEATEQVLNIIRNLEQVENKLEDVKKRSKPIQESLDQLKSDIQESEQLKETITESEKSLAELSDKEVDIKLALARINEYNEKLKNIQDDLDAVTLIREATDIKTGIPLLSVGSYLSPIKARTNELMDMIYDGKFRIDFDVTDQDFFIPVFKDGVQSAKDILLASQGETSNAKIALSMGIVDRIFKLSDGTYNIIYLDELDSELDKNARENFLELLDRQLDAISCEQAFIITHNNFFDSEPAGLVLLKGSDVDLEDEMFMHNKHLIYKV
ncbi:hypothetical protein [Proteus mirabilis]|uniref:hypothetical protein n=1 Tax=Proteus mirabilis TaxID=584 RepID=UPI0034D402C5